MQDEFVYVLEGEGMLITDEGETRLTPGMCAGFKAGVPNGHHIVNRSNHDFVYLEIGDRTPGGGGVYPDDDIVIKMVEGKTVITSYSIHYTKLYERTSSSTYSKAR